MKNRPGSASPPTRNAKLQLVTAKALEADKKASVAKEKARLAKIKLKSAKRDFKEAKSDLKAAKKLAKKALKEATHAQEALQVCLDQIAKEKKNIRKRFAADKATGATPALSAESAKPSVNDAKRKAKNPGLPSRQAPAPAKGSLSGPATGPGPASSEAGA